MRVNAATKNQVERALQSAFNAGVKMGKTIKAIERKENKQKQVDRLMAKQDRFCEKITKCTTNRGGEHERGKRIKSNCRS